MQTTPENDGDSAVKLAQRLLLTCRKTIRAIAACAVFVTAADHANAAVRGLPFSRIYSLEDIGYIPRGSKLDFDAFGRLAVIHEGVYAVLNDTTWLHLADTEGTVHVPMITVARGPDGRSYYGGRASWGVAELGTDGKLHAVPLMNPNPPAWTLGTTFEDLIMTPDGVYFASKSGVIFWDVVKGEPQLFELQNSKVFKVGEKVFVSSFEQPLRYIDVENRIVRTVPGTSLNGEFANVVERATVLDDTRALVAMLDGRLLAFDGETATPWSGQTRHDLTGGIAVLQQLADGNIAIGITGKGVFILSPEGELHSSLTIPQYHRVSDIASRESGVMWLINEDSIEKVLYASPLTTFGQRLGLPLDWPLVALWQDRTFVASGGVLYETASTSPGATARFERLQEQPPNGAWALAGWGPHLLVGNESNIYTMQPDGSYAPVTHVPDLAHLVMVSPETCYAIGRAEIALLEWNGERWIEPAPRIPGVRNAFIVHRAADSTWIEMGADGVARVSRKNGQLELMTLANQSWTNSLWVNIGVVDNVVVLSATRTDRRFFDERSERWCEMPELSQLLDRSPAWLARVQSDEAGNLWATHYEGLVRFTPKNGDYEMDVTSFDLINDRYPVVRVLPGNEVWIVASRSLHHVEPGVGAIGRPAAPPVLVSMADTRRNIELLATHAEFTTPLRLPFAQNSLTFGFFSGSYAWRRAPVYEFRLNPSESWAPLDSDSILRFTELREGNYRLQVRIAGTREAPGPPLTFPFEILPPWHRTWPAYAVYISALLFGVVGAVRWSGKLARKRHRALEALVHDRTAQLESTMQKLNEETRITATLAERDRLAGEIHDSVQQGLSGAILQLDTTLKLPSVTGDVRGRLNVVRNMVSYARQEVQHAVWDMDSPLLEGNDLGDALRKLTTFIISGALVSSVHVSGTPRHLPRATTHHLLRIAQEAATNSMRHANARQIEIRLEYQAEAVSLEISDDGIGFHPEDVLNLGGHFGLRGIRGRAKKLRGQLAITSSPGEGTSIHVLVPLTNEAPVCSDAEVIRPQ